MASLFREQVSSASQGINAQPTTPQEEEKQFQFRRKIIEGIISRVCIFKDKSTRIDLEFEFEDMLGFPKDEESLRIKYSPSPWSINDPQTFRITITI